MKVSIEEHRRIVDDFVSFMAGNDKRFTRETSAKMKAAAAEQRYEDAAAYRDQLEALEAVLAKSTVVMKESTDADLFGIEHDELSAAVQQFSVRGGRIRGVRSWTVDKELDVSTGDLVEGILRAAYSRDQVEIPRQVIVPVLPEDSADIEAWLSDHRLRGRCALKTAQRGEKASLMETATLNAKQALQRHKLRRSSDFVTRSQALNDIQESLDMDQAPLRIECFDISHLQGTNIVASMVVFEDGLPRKNQYRRFSLSESSDDTDSMYQVLTRRLRYLADEEAEPAGEDEEGKPKKFSYPPQLLLVDGGKPQVAAAQRALDESGVGGIHIAGIAKRLEELWVPDSDFPVILPRNSEALYLVQRLRDEAHRFAITYQRSKRKRDIGSVLGEIPGVGPARVSTILSHFGSVARLKQASAEELTAVKGVGPALAQTIHAHLHSR